MLACRPLIAQQSSTNYALSFQQHSWPDMLAEMRAATGWRRYPMRLIAPLARLVLRRRAAYRDAPGRYADPWGAIRTRIGDPRPDSRDRLAVG